MMSARTKPLAFGVGGLVLVWLLVWGGYAFFGRSEVTPEKLAAYMRSVDLAGLSGEARAKALRKLAEQMNALNPEQRREARLEGEWRQWFEAMTEEEKAAFIEATLPSGVKQMLTAFEQLPEEKRRQAVEDALGNLRRARNELDKGGARSGEWGPQGENPEDLSPELRERMVQLGLNSFYAESSAQTKAELAPVLEEMQRLMERGTFMRPGRRFREQ